MKRNSGLEFLFGIFIIIGFIAVLALLYRGCTIIMKSYGFQFENTNSNFYFFCIFIIIVVLFFIYFGKLKAYILLWMDIILNKKHAETLLKNFRNEVQTQTKNYQKLKNGIDEIDKIL